MASLVRSKWKPPRALYKNAILFAFLFGIGFGVIGLLEHRFAVWQISDGESSDLLQTVGDVSESLIQNGHWDLAYYRQWDNSTPSSYFIISDTGQLVDIKGDPSDFLRSTVPPDQYVPPRPTLIKTDIGETWLIQNRRIDGESVVGGIDAADLVGLKDPELLLSRELAKYGSTAKSADALEPTTLRNFVTGVITVKGSGEIATVGDGVPLRVRIEAPDQLLDGHVQTWRKTGSNYSLLSRRASAGSHSALIVAFDDMDTTAIDQSLRFNLLVAAASWLVAFLGYIGLSIRSALKKSEHDSSLEISTRQLIAQGENAPLEFKETFRWDVRAGKENDEMRLMVLKTIAAFLNTDGGTLLIGVADDRTIRGLGADKFKNADDAMLQLTNLVRDRISSTHLTFIKMRVEDMGDSLEVLRVDCRAASTPAYVRTFKNPPQLAFYVRTGPATLELPLDQVHPYIRTHFDDDG